MDKNKDGSITPTAGKIYIALSENENEGVRFEIYDMLDYKLEGTKFLASLARGMVEMAVSDPEAPLKTGIAVFLEEGKFVDTIKSELDGPNGESAFPLGNVKTEGNA